MNLNIADYGHLKPQKALFLPFEGVITVYFRCIDSKYFQAFERGTEIMG